MKTNLSPEEHARMLNKMKRDVARVGLIILREYSARPGWGDVFEKKEVFEGGEARTRKVCLQ
jgi:hypothetical protein